MVSTFQSRATGLNTRVGNAYAPEGQTGIGFSVLNGTVIVSITIDGKGYAAELKGDDIDLAGHFFANAVAEATLNDAPSTRSLQ